MRSALGGVIMVAVHSAMKLIDQCPIQQYDPIRHRKRDENGTISDSDFFSSTQVDRLWQEKTDCTRSINGFLQMVDRKFQNVINQNGTVFKISIYLSVFYLTF